MKPLFPLALLIASVALAAPQQEKPDLRAVRPGNARTGNARPGPAPLLDRLSNMNPEERQRALANLPPERREAMIKQLTAFETMPPGARDKAWLQLERLRALPPMRQNQVRRSLRLLQELPDDRKAAVGSELERLRELPAEGRLARMKSPDFASRYSKPERVMVENLAEILPPE